MTDSMYEILQKYNFELYATKSDGDILLAV